MSSELVILSNIRDILKLHLRVENDFVKQLVKDTPVTNLQDIKLKLATRPSYNSLTEGNKISRAIVLI